MKQRVIYLAKVYLLTVVMFIAAKVVFMWANHEGHTFGLGDVWDVIRHGFTLDLSTSLYLFIVPFLVTFASIIIFPISQTIILSEIAIASDWS